MARKNGGIRFKEKQQSPDIPEHLISLIEADAGLGVSKGLEDIIWTGGKDSLDLDDLLERDLEDHDALEQILWAIIEAYPGVSPIRGSHKIKKDTKIVRLEQACYLLVGRKIKRGDAPTLDRSKLQEIAEQYWQTYGDKTVDDVSQWEIVARIVAPNWRENGLAHDQVDNKIQAYVRALKKEKDKLLVRVSAKGLEQVEERKRKIAKIISLIKDLGIMNLSPTPSK